MKSITPLVMLMILLTSHASPAQTREGYLKKISQLKHGQGFSITAQKRLQSVIDSFQNNPANPFVGGMSAEIKVDGLADWEGATGYAARNVDENNNVVAGGTPFEVNTLSRTYSITKTFTAPLVLELTNEGAFKLDDLISKYIPVNAINPGLNSHVTIRQLLAHESGYSDFTDEINLQIAVAAQPTHVWTPYEMLSFVHQINPVGAVRKYSSTNYVLLGAIIETATGKKVEDFYRDRFFNPLGLGSMYFDVREQKPTNRILAAPHDNISAFNPVFLQTGQPVFPDAYTNISAFPYTAIASLGFTGGGIVSDVKDVADWGSALFNGKATGKGILDTMLQSISPNADIDGDRLGYGIFLSKKISGVYDFYGHDGNAPGYRSVMFYQPDKKLTLVILTNYHGADIYAIAKALYDAVPDFTCNNKKEEKVTICFHGNNLCLPRLAASRLIALGGTLGACDEKQSAGFAGEEATLNPKLEFASKNPEVQNVFPNPFTHLVTFSFKTQESGTASIRLYDMSGKMVATVFNGYVQKGILQQVSFDGSKLPAGIYMSRLQTDSGSWEQKLMKIQ
ncbi:MAG: serine hydrolase [Ginsengibacter sp.]